jgi:hypothetical protein
MRVVFDLDGTLSDNTHRRHHLKQQPANWEAFFAACPDDIPIQKVIAIAQGLFFTGHNVEIWTARCESVREQTKRWLEQMGVPFSLLLMRPIGDHRDDNILKREWLDRAESKGLPVDLVFEDRGRVVEMYRCAGVTCVQVAEDDSESK